MCEQRLLTIKMVMQNPLILDIIMSHLSLCDLKTCRLVCHYWNSISKQYFINLSVCCISNIMKKSIKIDLKLFRETFPNPYLYSFTKFHLEGEFTDSELEQFFDDWTFIKQLTLKKLKVKDRAGVLIQRYDISRWDKLKLSDLTVPRGASALVREKKFLLIPLKYLGSIEKLIIKGATLSLNGRIAPTNVEIGPCRCERADGTLFHSTDDILDLNEHIDVTNLVELHMTNITQAQIHLNLRNCLRLKHLALHSADLIGWHNNLVLKRLDISHAHLHLASLPPSLEDLRFNWYTELRYLQYSEEETFPHLRSLGICDHDAPLFYQCPNLRRVVTVRRGALDMHHVPTTVMTILQSSPDCEIIGFRNEPLGKLVLQSVHQSDLYGLGALIFKCNPLTIVVCLPTVCSDANWAGGSHSPCTFRNFEKMIAQGRTFVLNHLRCDHLVDRLLEHPHLSQFINHKDEYSLCGSDVSKILDKKEYDAWVNKY